MADTIKTVKSSGGDYSSLSAWEAGQQKTIASGDREIAECYAFEDGGGTPIGIEGWTNNGEIIIRAAEGNRHNGSFGTGYRIVYTGSYHALHCYSNGPGQVTLDGISVRQTTGSSGYPAIYITIGQPFYFNNGLVYCNSDDVAIRFVCGSGGHGGAINSVFIAPNGGAAVSMYTGILLFYNCIAIAPSGVAFSSRYWDSCAVKNCYAHGATCWDFSESTPTVMATNRHSSSQSVTGSTGSTAYSTANFTNVTAGSEDFSLPAGSALIDAGTDLSADADYPFSTDILGVTRATPWDIGPFEYAGLVAANAPKGWFDRSLLSKGFW